MISINTEMPDRIARLPKNKVGYPVPWFVATIDGVPDFRVARGKAIRDALKYSLCWICGCPFPGGEERAFLVGGMCLINHVSAEPPSHVECATWSARNCPFLATPNMTRRERHMPGGTVSPAGIMLRRNPGVALVAVTGYREWREERGPDGSLFRFTGPRRALWYAEGRAATRAEVLASIDSGLPLLREVAEKDGPDAVAELDRMHAAALAFLPPPPLAVAAVDPDAMEALGQALDALMTGEEAGGA